MKHTTKKGTSHCHSCQHFGHGSRNCNHSIRCVKFGDKNSTKECAKIHEKAPVYCNCGGSHTANYRGYPSYVSVIQTTNIKQDANYSTSLPSKLPNPNTPIQTTFTKLHKHRIQIKLTAIINTSTFSKLHKRHFWD